MNGLARFVSMQNHYNLLYREEEREMMPLCEAEGIGMIPWSPLARGMLAGTRTSLDDRESTARARADTYAHDLYNDPAGWDIVTAVQSVAGERGVSPEEVSLAWLLSKPAVAAPIISATMLDHLDAPYEPSSCSWSPARSRDWKYHIVPKRFRGTRNPRSQVSEPFLVLQ